MKVLIGIDGSAGSFEALRQVGDLLTPQEDQLALYYSPPDVRLRGGDPELRTQARRAMSQGILTEARAKLPPGLQSGVQPIEGAQDPRRGIPLAAEQWRADLIVVGARGLGAVERLLLGSVSRSVAHAAKTPVWIARPKQGGDQGFRILLTCETPQTGQGALELIRRISWPKGSSCRVMTVVHSFFGGQVPDWLLEQARGAEVEAFAKKWVHEHQQAIDRNLASMRDLALSLPAGLPSEEPLVAEGEPADQILAAINRDKADLVVIGVKHRHSIADAIFGSTSEAVLNHANCSVLLVPHHETP
jgi:nucleotide-binding universal stress UspA family protein